MNKDYKQFKDQTDEECDEMLRVSARPIMFDKPLDDPKGKLVQLVKCTGKEYALDNDQKIKEYYNLYW